MVARQLGAHQRDVVSSERLDVPTMVNAVEKNPKVIACLGVGADVYHAILAAVGARVVELARAVEDVEFMCRTFEYAQ
jgi:hypothetical protein